MTKAATLPIDEAPATREVSLQRVESVDPTIAMVERLVKDPTVDVNKLEKMIELHERVLARNAKAEFDAAYIEMVTEIPSIDEKGRILDKAGKVQSTFSRFEDIQAVTKPVLQRYGFALRFKTNYPDGKVLVTGILHHRAGHEETSDFLAAPDDTGSKNAIQARGSSSSYGRRYTTIDLLNIESRLKADRDDDGQSSEAPAPPDDKYEQWEGDLIAASDNGWPAFKEAWNGASKDYWQHFLSVNPGRKDELQKKALTISRKQKAGAK